MTDFHLKVWTEALPVCPSLGLFWLWPRYDFLCSIRCPPLWLTSSWTFDPFLLFLLELCFIMTKFNTFSIFPKIKLGIVLEVQCCSLSGRTYSSFRDLGHKVGPFFSTATKVHFGTLSLNPSPVMHAFLHTLPTFFLTAPPTFGVNPSHSLMRTPVQEHPSPPSSAFVLDDCVGNFLTSIQ